MRVRASITLLLPVFLLAGSCEGDSESGARKDGGAAGTSGAAGASGTAGASTGGTMGVGGATGGLGGASGAAGNAGTGTGGDAGAGGESAGGDSGSGGASGQAGAGTGGTSAGEAGAGGTGGDSCMPVTTTSTLRPSAIVIMFDRSGSMIQSQMPPTRWERVTAGLRLFLTDPASVGLGVGLRLYPHDLPVAGCASPACNAAACSELLSPVTTLTVKGGTSLSNLVGSYAPVATGGGASGGTPTSVAVEGMLAAARAYAVAHPLEKTSAIFVTDGEPNGCNENLSEIAVTVGAALSTSWIHTYLIGVSDSQLTVLEPLAAAGGTQAMLALDGATQINEFSRLLHVVRASPAGCDLPFPLATQGTVDPELVEVERVATGGGRTTLVRVPSAAGCGTVPSWYNDTRTAPGRIVLCPSVCDTAVGDPGLSFDVVVGCPP